MNELLRDKVIHVHSAGTFLVKFRLGQNCLSFLFDAKTFWHRLKFNKVIVINYV